MRTGCDSFNFYREGAEGDEEGIGRGPESGQAADRDKFGRLPDWGPGKNTRASEDRNYRIEQS